MIDEKNILKKACDQFDNERLKYRNILWEHLYGTYEKYLLYHINRFNEEKLPPKAKLPYPAEDILQDFLVDIIEKDKLCKFRSSVKFALTLMLENFLKDLMKKYSEIKENIENDSKRRVIKHKKPLPSSSEDFHILINGKEIENPQLYKSENISDVEKDMINNLEIQKINVLINKSFLLLQRIYPLYAKIIYLESKGIPRNNIAKIIGKKQKGINKYFERAYEKFFLSFKKTLIEAGYDIVLDDQELKNILKYVIKK